MKKYIAILFFACMATTSSFAQKNNSSDTLTKEPVLMYVKATSAFIVSDFKLDEVKFGDYPMVTVLMMRDTMHLTQEVLPIELTAGKYVYSADFKDVIKKTTSEITANVHWNKGVEEKFFSACSSGSRIIVVR
ncbi:MAG: hypothetical protein WCO58_03190 [bacterium]